VTRRPGLKSFIRAELARRHANRGGPTGWPRGPGQGAREPSRAAASVEERGLGDTGREASAAASMPLAAALRPTRESTPRVALRRMRDG
jgi:hypothetical protein